MRACDDVVILLFQFFYYYWPTYTRKQDLDVVSALGGLGASIHKVTVYLFVVLLLLYEDMY